MIQSAMLLLTTFLFIFGWKINALADIILLTSLALVVLSFLRGYIYVDRTSLKVVVCLGLLSVYSLAIVLLHGLFDAQIALRSLRALINFLGALSLAGIYFECHKNQFFRAILRDLYLSLVIHAGIMLGMYLHGGLRDFIYHLTSARDYVNLSSPFLEGLRICGLTYGLSQTSVLQMLGLLLLPVVVKNCPGRSGKIFMLICAPLLLFSVLISGRSGLMIGLVFLPVYLLSLLVPSSDGFSPTRIFCRALANLSGIALIGLFLWSAISLLPEKFSSYSLHQAQEIFFAFKLSGPTVDNMSGMFFLPDTWFEVFFGSSNLNHGSLEKIQSDVGWVKNIFAIGVIGTLLTIIPYLLALQVAWRSRAICREAAIISFLVFLSALILNCKEMALLTRNQWSVQALLLSALCLQLYLTFGDRQLNSERLKE